MWLWINGNALPIDSLLWDCNTPASMIVTDQCGAVSVVSEKTQPVNTQRLRLKQYSCNTSSAYYPYFICGETSGLEELKTPEKNISKAAKMLLRKGVLNF